MEWPQRYIDQFLANRRLTHVVYWLIVLIYYPLPTSFFLKAVYLLPSVLATYFLLYYQLPKYIYRRRYLRFFASLIFSAYVFAVLYVSLWNHVVAPNMYPGYTSRSFIQIVTDLKELIRIQHWIYILPLISVVIKLIKQNFETQQQITILKKEKSRAEINFLKAQIHPRFLTNTLGLLHTLTLRKSDSAPEVVIRLSEMLDYMLYQCNDPEVLIEKEIAQVKNYLDLDALRRNHQLRWQIKHLSDNQQAGIAPLLLIGVTEHILDWGISEVSFVNDLKINLELQKDQLLWQAVLVAKGVSERVLAQAPKKAQKSNLSRQLQLLYPSRHELIEKKSDQKYEMTLNIQLSNFTK